MKHHPLEERQEPPSVDEILASIEAGHRAEQANQASHVTHARSLSDVELCDELAEAKRIMKDAPDAAHYLDARARRNAALDVLYEQNLRVQSHERDSGLEL